MGKKIKIILFIIAFMFVALKSYAQEQDIDVKLRAGTFLKVINLAEFSTLTSDIDDEAVFMNTQDMYVYETNVIPENTKIYGEVEDVLEPMEGRDGAIKVKIIKMITPDKKVYKIKGHIYTDNDNYLGGKQTLPVYYRKVPHYTQRIRPILKAVPLNVPEMGKHTVIKPGAELFVILEEDITAK